MELLKAFLKRKHLVAILRDPRHRALRLAALNEVLIDVLNRLSVEEVQIACDTAGVSRQGYEAIYNMIANALARNKIKHMVLPRPFRLRSMRQTRNASIGESIGQYFFITEHMEVEGSQPGKTISYDYNRFNNIFVDLIRLQCAMARFYKVQCIEGIDFL